MKLEILKEKHNGEIVKGMHQVDTLLSSKAKPYD